MTSNEFLKQIVPAAVKAEKEFHIPAEVTVGQAILESAWGQSKLTQRANNLFGIKAGPEWKGKVLTMGTHEWCKGRMVSVGASWRVYNTFQDSVDDHSKFLMKPRYKKAFEFTGNYAKFIEEVYKAGYATDPEYVSKILNIVKKESIKYLIVKERGEVK